MKVAIILAIVAFAGVSFGAVLPREDLSDRLIEQVLVLEKLECILNVIEYVNSVDPSFPYWGQQLTALVKELAARRQTCLDIVSDPPRPFEEIASEYCLAAWNLYATAEIARFAASVRSDIDAAEKFLETLAAGVEECREI